MRYLYLLYNGVIYYNIQSSTHKSLLVDNAYYFCYYLCASHAICAKDRIEIFIEFGLVGNFKMEEFLCNHSRIEFKLCVNEENCQF
jgi:hypothetical protein